MTVHPTMMYTVIKSVAVMLHTKDNPSDAEWDEIMARIDRDHGRYRCALIITEGGGPNTMQRGQMTDTFDAKGFKGKVAVVTVNRIARGIVTALSWFNPNVKAFSTVQVNAALEYLEVPAADQDIVRAEIKRIRVQLGLPVA